MSISHDFIKVTKVNDEVIKKILINKWICFIGIQLKKKLNRTYME